MDLKPMLAAKIKTEAEFAAIKFPVMVSPKFDGIRNTVQRGVALSRTLKNIPNKNVQAVYGNPALDGFDGEFIVGPPTAEDVFARTTSIVMSDSKPIDELVYYVFDNMLFPGAFAARLKSCHKRLNQDRGAFREIVVVEHEYAENMEELLAYEEARLAEGYEGIMLRDPNGVYKHGRSTLNDRGLAAIKRFTDAEAIVVDTYEQEENTNEKQVNELGRSKRSSAKAGKVGKGTLGGFNVIVNPEDEAAFAVFGTAPFKVGTGLGLTQTLRQTLWDDREAQIGKIVKFKYQAVGVKDKPRLPIWLGFRDRMDM